MAGQPQLKALDGSVGAVNGTAAPSGAAADTQLPSRPKLDGMPSSKSSIPPPGSTLTGKQEHCKTDLQKASWHFLESTQ